MSFTISVCAPAYNEGQNIERFVGEASAAFRARGIGHEIIVVDDGSTDDTAEVLARLGEGVPELRVIRHARKSGYGVSLRDAIALAGNDYLLLTDADGQFDLSDIDAFLPLLNGRNAVVGYRARRAEGLRRAAASRGYNLVIRLVFGLVLRDIDCSFKLLPTTAVQALPLESDAFFIDAEILLRLHRCGVPIRELPVRHRRREAGRSTVSPIHVLTTVGEIVSLSRALR